MVVIYPAGIFTVLLPWLGKKQHYDNMNPFLIVRITRAETCVMMFELHQSMMFKIILLMYVFMCRWDGTFEGLLSVLGLWFLL